MYRFNIDMRKEYSADGKLSVTLSIEDSVVATFIEGFRYEGAGELKQFIDTISCEMGSAIDLIGDPRTVPSVSLYINSSETPDTILLIELGVRNVSEFGLGVDLLNFNVNSVKYLERFIHNLSKIGRLLIETENVLSAYVNKEK